MSNVCLSPLPKAFPWQRGAHAAWMTPCGTNWVYPSGPLKNPLKPICHRQPNKTSIPAQFQWVWDGWVIPRAGNKWLFSLYSQPTKACSLFWSCQSWFWAGAQDLSPCLQEMPILDARLDDTAQFSPSYSLILYILVVLYLSSMCLIQARFGYSAGEQITSTDGV